MDRKTVLNILLYTLLTSGLITACSKPEEPQSPTADTQITEKQVTPDESTSAAAGTERNAESEVAEVKEPVVETAEEPAKESTPQAAANEEPASAIDTNDHKEQLSLARKSGCLVCHAVDKKVVGPAWRDVSKRYRDDPDAKAKLVAKVSKGGRGNWTDVVGTAAMPPYSPRVSDKNIALLVDFVLSLEQ